MGQVVTITWTGQTLTLDELREFVQAVGDGTSGDQRVTVRVAPTSPSPTDPGGEISLSCRIGD